MDELRVELQGLLKRLRAEKDYCKIDEITFLIKECELKLKKIMGRKEKELHFQCMDKDWFEEICLPLSDFDSVKYEQILTDHKYTFLRLAKDFKTHKVNVYFKRSDDNHNYYTYPAELFFSQFIEVK